MELAAFQPDIAPNLGAMIRLTSCFGVGLDVIEPCGFPLSDKTLRRAAMDYTQKARITRHIDWERFCANRKPGRLILLSTKTSTQFWDFAFETTDTLLVGQESSGVPDHVRDHCDHAITIPMPGGGRSLNVGMAAGMALAEAMRQLHHSPQTAIDEAT